MPTRLLQFCSSLLPTSARAHTSTSEADMGKLSHAILSPWLPVVCGCVWHVAGSPVPFKLVAFRALFEQPVVFASLQDQEGLDRASTSSIPAASTVSGSFSGHPLPLSPSISIAVPTASTRQIRADVSLKSLTCLTCIQSPRPCISYPEFELLWMTTGS